MKRSIRRHQQWLAKRRRIRILRARGAYAAWCRGGFVTPLWQGPDKPWADMSRLVMNEPGWWRHEKSVVPARIDCHRLAHSIQRGTDPDGVLWPDCQRPCPYYW
jgi:hypothetical protein